MAITYTMKTLIIILLLTLVLWSKANGQLFEHKELYPGIATIKSKYFNGSDKRRYSSKSKPDIFGRIVEKKSFRKNQLLATYKYVYNDHHDQLYYMVSDDINHPGQEDTIISYEYKYQSDRIIYQKSVGRNKQDSAVVKLIENKRDTILIYQLNNYYFREKSGTKDTLIEMKSLYYHNNLLIKLEEVDLNRNSKTTTQYEYFPNGLLKRRKIVREPEPELKGHYVGGPGSDDEFYKYKFAKSGRIRTFYKIVGDETYKIATYKYKRIVPKINLVK